MLVSHGEIPLRPRVPIGPRKPVNYRVHLETQP